MKKDKKMYFFHNVHTKYYPLSWVKYKSSQTINKWTTPDTALWQLQMLLCFWAAHLLHGEPYTILALLPQIKFVLLRRQGEEDYIFICLSIFSDPDQSQTEEWLCCLLSHSHTWMNVKANAPKRWDLIMCHLYGFCVTEEKKWNTFRWIIALVNNGRFPVLHSIMVRMGSACFITER